VSDTQHLLAIARLCEELRTDLEQLRPTASDPTWPTYLETVGTVAAIWHHLEEINTAERDDIDPHF
jgi:hypothetical protein